MGFCGIWLIEKTIGCKMKKRMSAPVGIRGDCGAAAGRNFEWRRGACGQQSKNHPVFVGFSGGTDCFMRGRIRDGGISCGPGGNGHHAPGGGHLSGGHEPADPKALRHLGENADHPGAGHHPGGGTGNGGCFGLV